MKERAFRWLGPAVIAVTLMFLYDVYGRPLLDDLRFLRAARIQAMQQATRPPAQEQPTK